MNNNLMKMTKKSQQGLVLFIALVALVVMSLAAVALIRSVDTNTQVTGNLILKQSATLASHVGLEAMANTIGKKDMVDSEDSDPTIGYYAVCSTYDQGVTDECNGKNIYADATWTNNNSALANGTGFTSGVDSYGNTVRYIVERMCRNTGVTGKDHCILAADLEDNGSKNAQSAENGGQYKESSPVALALYRVTVRIKGPKNTVNFLQAFFS